MAQRFMTPNAIVTPLATERLGSHQVSVIHQSMLHGHKNPIHTQTTDEVMVMLGGTVIATVDGESDTLMEGDVLIVPANTPHCIENISGAAAEWLIISPSGMRFFGSNGDPLAPEWAR